MSARAGRARPAARYVVTTGWWCDGTGVHPGTGWNASSPLTRRREFFSVWYDFATRYTDPAKIVVVDSASPVRPELPDDGRLEFLSLADNFGHAFGSVGRLCGWSRACLLGMLYGLLNDAPYTVFVEQDCLVYGDAIIEAAIANMGKAGISHGLWDHDVGVEQSLVVVAREYVLPFVTAYLALERSDRRMLPEEKFRAVHRRHRRFVELPFGYGRRRPVNFSDARFYAQHWSREELAALSRVAPSLPLRELLARERAG